MLFRNLGNRKILEEVFSGELEAGSEFVSCDIDGIQLERSIWNDVGFSNCNANGISFRDFHMTHTSFVRSSLMRSLFDGGTFDGCTFSGTTLIRTGWNAAKINDTTFFQCTMQRMTMRRCVVLNSRFSDFEGIDASVSDCLFLNCHFEVTYGGGMNGFSGAEFKNCIFSGCSFSGYPLRGVHVRSCVFKNCRGEITDDVECHDSVGIGGFRSVVQGIPLSNKVAALQFITKMGGRK
ncbi:MAG: pentapeptide repeat-containing protein [Ruminococcus flavefaciens]|nr:pentapeptide repeat-containing protein [Ruminococcus flavefaciens]